MESVLYVGTDDGVVAVRGGDGGHWEAQDRTLKGWAIPEVAPVPGAPNQVLAGTRGDGVWFSEDLGQSWKKPSYGKRGPGKVRCVTVDPQDSRRIYAGTEPIDVFVSEDLCKSWLRLDSVWDDPFVATVPYPVATVEPHVRDITVDPTDPNVVYAALQVGYILKSSDGGETWRLLNKDLDCDVHTIVVDPTNPSRIIVATGGHDFRLGRAPGRALYMSEDGGETWSPTALDFSQEYSVPLTMNPKDHNVLYSALAHGQPNQWRRETGAESLVIRSKDGGKSWERLERGIVEASKEFPEAIVVDEEDPNRVYAACRNGEFYTSADGGDSWSGMDVKIPGVSDVKLVHA